MRKRQTVRSTLAILLVLAALPTASASIVVIDFDALDTDLGLTPGNIGQSYIEDGFVVSVPETMSGQPFLAVVGDQRADYTGSAAILANITTTATITVAAENSQPFDAISIDLAKFLTSGDRDPLEFTGHLQGGGTVTQSFTIQGSDPFDPPPTFTFDASFKNLTSLTWDNTFISSFSTLHQFDNITLEAIPEPSSALVAGTLLCLAFGCRRRRRTRAVPA